MPTTPTRMPHPGARQRSPANGGIVIQLVVADVGGTHARFALAEVEEDKVVSLGTELVLRTAEHTSFHSAWEAFSRSVGHPLPSAAAIAVAAPVGDDVIRFTNNPWIIRPKLIANELGLRSHVVLNDFAAVAHAVAHAGVQHFLHVCGPWAPLPANGTICVIGPGTGFGVAHVQRDASGYRVNPTEGGHIGFAPADRLEDAILSRLRQRYRRVSLERVVSGPGLAEIYMTIARIEGRAVQQPGDAELWSLALAGEDSLALAALDRFCRALGTAAGDLALAQGAAAVVIAGGLGFRIRDHLLRPGFAERFRDKGRFQPIMERLPVKIIVHPEPGLFGAAAAFATSNAKVL